MTASRTPSRKRSALPLFAPRVLASALSLVVFSAFASGAGATPEQTYAERSIMRIANQRCRLFDANVTQALFMAEAQARNATLRAGGDNARMREIAGIAHQKAASLACNDPVLTSEATRVRSAFSAYARMLRMTFPGSAAAWKADRTVLASRVDTGRWALTTSAVHMDADTHFGVVVIGGRLSLFATPPASGGSPATARLVMRDTDLADRPYLSGALTSPPRSVSKVFLAAERRSSPDGQEGFRFSDAAAEALAALDPREAIVVEFVYTSSQGERVTRALYEVGDFAPAYGFLKLPHV